MSSVLRSFSILLILILTYLIGTLHYIQQDSSSYFMALDILDGYQVSDRLMRLSKPISLILPYLLTKIGFSNIVAFMMQSILSVCLCIYFIQGVLQRYFDSSTSTKINTSASCFLSFCILLGCQCTAVYGLAVLTDSLSWAIILGLIYYIHQIKTLEIKHLFCIGLSVGIGFFVKESCLLVLIFFAFHLFLGTYSLIQVLRKLGLVYSITIFVIACISLFQDIYLGYSFLDWYTLNKTDSPSIAWSDTLKQLFRTLDFYWLFLFYIIITQFDQIRRDRFVIALLLTSLVCMVLLPFVWDYHYDRIQFIGVLPLLPLLGIYGKAFPYNQCILSILALANLVNTFLIYRYQYSLIYIGTAITGTLIIGHYLLVYKKSPN